jgi:hypothetical protein
MQGVLGVLQVWYCVEETRVSGIVSTINTAMQELGIGGGFSTTMKEKVHSFDVIFGIVRYWPRGTIVNTFTALVIWSKL